MLGMSERKTSGWVQQNNDALAAAIAAKQEQALNRMTIKIGGSRYWADVRDELKSVSENLAKPLLGRFHHSNFDTSRSVDHCQLAVSFIGDGTTHRNSHVDLWYRPETQEIWYKSTLRGENVSLRPCVVDGRVHTITESHTDPMDAESAAELVARPLVEHAMSGILVAA
jgi:hypothetical protein